MQSDSIIFDVRPYIIPVPSALPEGFDTVASFIARNWPDEIEDLVSLMGADPFTAYEREEQAMREASAILGFPVHEVQHNGRAVPAFDVRALRAMLPTTM